MVPSGETSGLLGVGSRKQPKWNCSKPSKICPWPPSTALAEHPRQRLFTRLLEESNCLTAIIPCVHSCQSWLPGHEFWLCLLCCLCMLPPKQKMSGLDNTLWSSFVRNYVYQLLATMLNCSQLHFSGTLKPIIWSLDLLIPCLPANLWGVHHSSSSCAFLTGWPEFTHSFSSFPELNQKYFAQPFDDTEECSLISVWLF